ncbi:glycosyltransferase family 2 protein [Methylobacillus flagellatus]|uniref:glycosyltransferase family 2 protein n=1 Tax=Methylobacillus flagellatus TaxID=405 RepID=UPI0010F5702C|nr:glycosyltransferase [Methylobacillus flagellatus]
MAFYFDQFEQRRPEPPLPYSPVLEALWQFLFVIALVLGAWYVHWRWIASLNYDALWYAIPLVIAETGAYIGLILFAFNLWKVKDYPRRPPPQFISECTRDEAAEQRPLKVDVFFPSYDEDPELVRLSVRDAKRVTYPHPIELNIYVLDDGRRPSMKQMADEEGVGYFTRSNNIGFKAGNMRNAMEQTSGDFIVICDADTRPFPTILEHTLGYFRDPDVAWVQTPQWFFDLPEGKPLPAALQRRLGRPGYWLGRGVERLIGPIRLGEDPFVNDPKMFYDLIQRRRNWANASFCCGAGSIHRRDAVMEAALKGFADEVERKSQRQLKQMQRLTGEKSADTSTAGLLRQGMAQEEELTPYRFHVSEDIYTSIVLHSDPHRKWKSVMHPEVESKMLSPQDLLSWTIQRFKYAGGTLDIAVHDNPVMRPGLSLPQRLMYLTTVWSYLGGVWNLIFLIAPLVYLFTAIAPVSAYSIDFYKHILPFLVATEIAFMAAYWGISSYKAKTNYLSFFPINLRAIWTVMRGQKIKFPTTPKDRQEGNFFHLVMPQFVMIMLTLLGLLYAWLQYLLFAADYTLNGLIVNTFWGMNNVVALSGIVLAAFWQPEPAAASTAELAAT